MSVIGIPLALVLAALYCISLLVGFLTAVIFIGDAGLRLLQRKDQMHRGARLLSLLGGLFLIFVMTFIPVVGSLLIFGSLLFGLGAWIFQSYRVYAAY